MALRKTKKVFGYDFNYWMITSRNYSKEYNRTEFVVSLYKNQDMRQEDVHSAIESYTYNLDGEQTTEACYNYLKTLSEYKDAEDC